MSALTTYIAASMVYREEFWIATTLTVASILLLELKAALEGLTKWIAPDEILTFAKIPAAHSGDSARPPDQDLSTVDHVVLAKRAAARIARTCLRAQHSSLPA